MTAEWHNWHKRAITDEIFFVRDHNDHMETNQQQNFILIHEKKNQHITNTDYLQTVKLIQVVSMKTYHLHFYNTNT